jgi:hypothetical protein
MNSLFDTIAGALGIEEHDMIYVEQDYKYNDGKLDTRSTILLIVLGVIFILGIVGIFLEHKATKTKNKLVQSIVCFFIQKEFQIIH